MSKFRAGVLYGQELIDVYEDAKANGYALPGVNAVGTNTVNGILETAAKVASPVIVQLSFGGGHFYAGKSLPNDNLQASAAGCLSAAHHVHQLAEMYGVPAILHTDHCSLSNIAWIDHLLDYQEKYYEQFGRPLFSSHMLDLSEETLEENIEICEKYLARMSKIDVGLEIELGITGGEEDGVDNSEVDSSKLYTHPHDVFYAYERLSKISSNFTVAAAFGNVHGVYKPGNVKLSVEILKNSQNYVADKIGRSGEKPVSFVFHGGSGSSEEDISLSIDYGVIKMNLDTDMQWAFSCGLRDYFAEYQDYVATQIGNPDGDDLPNKKYYDPRKMLRKAEESFIARLEKSFADLKCIGRNR
ncbi:class II fructose-bisphosphate aldolase [Arenicella chitinivorans]|uniref:Fructose-bisphosphate aldolase n=1 Tax=Arenicella chitinivorans TaxID=1329800 RepID=A0A918RV59_9GAMM|nr:class II fructose-bisphosphate aldolase [Arenicella chitinivorans]GHA12137.1 class II fructose-bisphosphate aldolase [Arenicella chitinivorans]